MSHIISNIITPNFANKGHVISPFGLFAAIGCASQFFNKSQNDELSAKGFDLTQMKKIPHTFSLSRYTNHFSFTYLIMKANENNFDPNTNLLLFDSSKYPKSSCQFINGIINQRRTESLNKKKYK
jgi:hypothetical protein